MRKKLWVSLFTLLGAATLQGALILFPGFARAFRDAISLPLGAFLRDCSLRVSFPVGEAAFLLLTALFVLLILRAVFSCLKKKSGLPLLRALCALLLAGSILLMGYGILWSPIASSSRLQSPEAGVASSELESLAKDLIARANGLSVLSGTWDAAAVPAMTQSALARLTEVENAPRVKYARYPEWFSRLDIAGLYVPFTGEVLVNPSESDYSLPFIAAHESAHALGYGREDEANYIAYRACMRGNAYQKFSGALHALSYAMEALKGASPGVWLSLQTEMNQTVYSHFYRMNGLGNAQSTGRERLLGGISDAFLRLNGQDGLKSYGLMVDLLIRDRRSDCLA